MTISEFFSIGRLIESSYTHQFGYISRVAIDFCGNLSFVIQWQSGKMTFIKLEDDIELLQNNHIIVYSHILDISNGKLFCQLQECRKHLEDYTILTYDFNLG